MQAVSATALSRDFIFAKLWRSTGCKVMLAAFVTVLALLCAAAPLRANTHMMPTSPEQPPFIKIEQAFEYMPDAGYIPLRITITNPYESTRTWVIANQTQRDRQSHFAMQGHTDWRQELTVPAGQMRVFEVLYPVVNRSSWYNDRNFTVQGTGVDDSFLIRGNRDNYRHHGNARIYALLSEQLRLKYGERIAPYLSDHGTSLLSGSGQMYFLPTDWRGYTSANIICFQQSDWEKLAADQRLPILQWVAQGGDLRILKDAGIADEAAVSGLPGSGNGLIAHGGGLIRVYPHLSEEELFQYLPETLKQLGASSYREDHTPATERTPYSARTAEVYEALHSNFWTLPRPIPGIEHIDPSFGTVPLNAYYHAPEPSPLLVIFAVFVVAIILGPVNLWVFARGRKRYRLLITTPILSALLSLLIAAVILLDDGIGGDGVYSQLFILTPDNQEVLITGQKSRTGLLLNGEFSLPAHVWLTPPFSPEGLRSIDSNTPYSQHGNTYRGNWFGSRRSQEQTLVSIRPSRSGFEIRQDGGKLYVVSGFPATCPVLYLTGADGKSCYRATNVTTGRPALLEPADYAQFEQWLLDTYFSLGEATAQKVPHIRVRQGYIYASVENYTGDSALALEKRIDWQHHHSLVTAPATFVTTGASVPPAAEAFVTTGAAPAAAKEDSQ